MGIGPNDPLTRHKLGLEQKPGSPGLPGPKPPKKHGFLDKQKEQELIRGIEGQAVRSSDMGFGALGSSLGDIRSLAGRLAGMGRGEDSVSAQQLRDSADISLAQQQALAASGRGNRALAARAAAQNQGRIMSGLSGQQALAGIQERQAANQALGSLLLGEGQLGFGLTGQALGAREGQLGREVQLAMRPKTPNFGDRLMGAVGGGGAALLANPGLFDSDDEFKINVKGATPDDLDRFVDALKAKTFNRKENPGGPEELGVIAQDIEDAPGGESIVQKGGDGLRRLSLPHLTTALTGAVGRLGERLDNLEKVRGESRRASEITGADPDAEAQSFFRDLGQAPEADLIQADVNQQTAEDAKRRLQLSRLLGRPIPPGGLRAAQEEFAEMEARIRGQLDGTTMTLEQRGVADALSRRTDGPPSQDFVFSPDEGSTIQNLGPGSFVETSPVDPVTDALKRRGLRGKVGF